MQLLLCLPLQPAALCLLAHWSHHHLWPTPGPAASCAAGLSSLLHDVRCAASLVCMLRLQLKVCSMSPACTQLLAPVSTALDVSQQATVRPHTQQPQPPAPVHKVAAGEALGHSHSSSLAAAHARGCTVVP